MTFGLPINEINKLTPRHCIIQTKKYFKEIGVAADVKYIDPTYMIRAVRANASDGILCTVLGQNAVKSLYTKTVSTMLKQHLIYITLSLSHRFMELLLGTVE